MLAILLLILAAPFVLPSPAAADGPWRAPVPGRVAKAYRYGHDPFAAGQRRGVDLAARPGERVVAPCTGSVAYAGAVPRFGLGVSLRCGRLTATVLRLRSITVRRGAQVRRRGTIGVAGGPAIRLGARVTADPFGYRDPLALLGDDPRPAPRAPRIVALPRRTPREPVPSPWRPAFAERIASPQHLSPLAWLGLALVAVSVPGGTLATRRRRARRVAARGAAQRAG